MTEWHCRECCRKDILDAGGWGLDPDACACDALSAYQMIEHLRKKHGMKSAIRPAANGRDCFGHEWYCFECSKGVKDHRSFNSDEATMQHIYIQHSSSSSVDIEPFKTNR
jgi:hypothetical protein